MTSYETLQYLEERNRSKRSATVKQSVQLQQDALLRRHSTTRRVSVDSVEDIVVAITRPTWQFGADDMDL